MVRPLLRLASPPARASAVRLRNIVVLVAAIYAYALIYSAVYIVVSIVTPAHIYG